MKNKSTGIEILKILGTFLASCVLWLLIFSIYHTSDNEANTTIEPFKGAICIFGIITATIVLLIINYNSMQRAYQKTKSMFSNISIFKDRNGRLLEKANKVADKYMFHEKDIQINVAEKRTRKVKFIRNSQQFQTELESYPDLKANQSIMELLSEIKETENGYAQAKINYNSSAEYYNSLIHSFPNNIINVMLKFKNVNFYDDSEDNEITDEELGI